MGDSIRKKARIAWEDEKEVTVCFEEDSELTGYISAYNGAEVGVRYNEKGIRPIPYKDITDIRFVDESEETDCAESPDSIRQKLEHARKFGYRVEVESYYGGKRNHHKGAVHSVLCDANVVFKSGETILLREIDQVQILYDGIEKEEPEEERPDVAKERWKPRHDETGRWIESSVGKRLALFSENATRAQVKVALTAPELLAKLEEVAKGAQVIKVGDEDVTMIPPGMLVGINELIKKARGR